MFRSLQLNTHPPNPFFNMFGSLQLDSSNFQSTTFFESLKPIINITWNISTTGSIRLYVSTKLRTDGLASLISWFSHPLVCFSTLCDSVSPVFSQSLDVGTERTSWDITWVRTIFNILSSRFSWFRFLTLYFSSLDMFLSIFFSTVFNIPYHFWTFSAIFTSALKKAKVFQVDDLRRNHRVYDVQQQG